jgi:hypothetical protein
MCNKWFVYSCFLHDIKRIESSKLFDNTILTLTFIISALFFSKDIFRAFCGRSLKFVVMLNTQG